MQWLNIYLDHVCQDYTCSLPVSKSITMVYKLELKAIVISKEIE